MAKHIIHIFIITKYLNINMKYPSFFTHKNIIRASIVNCRSTRMLVAVSPDPVKQHPLHVSCYFVLRCGITFDKRLCNYNFQDILWLTIVYDSEQMKGLFH